MVSGGLSLKSGAAAKASLKKALASLAVDPKPGEPSMGRMKWG